MLLVFTARYPFLGWGELATHAISHLLSLVPEEALSLLCPHPTLLCLCSLRAGKESQVPGSSFCLAPSSLKAPQSQVWPACTSQCPAAFPPPRVKALGAPTASVGLGALIKAFSALSLGLPQAPWLKSDKGPLCWNCQSPLLRRELETSGISWGTDKALDSCQREHD